MKEEDYKLIYALQQGEISEEDRDELSRRIKEDEDFARMYLQFLEDEQMFMNVFSQLDLEKGEEAYRNIDPLELMRQDTTPVQPKVRLLKVVMGVAASLLLIFIIQLSSNKQKKLQPLQTQISHSGSGMTIIRNGKAIENADVKKLNNHDVIVLEPDADPVELKYPDGTIVVVHKGSKCELVMSGKSKTVRLDYGGVTCSVMAQPDEAPFKVISPVAEAIVLGTRFTVTADLWKTRLEVYSGKVKLVNNRSHHQHEKDYVRSFEAVVKAGEFAEAKEQGPITPMKVNTLNMPVRRVDRESFERWMRYTSEFRKDKNLMAYYDFQELDEEKKVLKDKSPTGGADGKIIKTTFVRGRFGSIKRGLFFYDLGYVDFGKPKKMNITDKVTLFAWVKVNNFTRKFQCIISKGDSAYRLQRNQDKNSIEFACSGVEGGILYGNRNIFDLKWHLLVGVYDGKSMKLYIDGVLDIEQPASGKIQLNNYSFFLGANQERPMRDFEGVIDEMGVLNRALSEKEIQEMFIKGNPYK